MLSKYKVSISKGADVYCHLLTYNLVKPFIEKEYFCQSEKFMYEERIN